MAVGLAAVQRGESLFDLLWLSKVAGVDDARAEMKTEGVQGEGRRQSPQVKAGQVRLKLDRLQPTTPFSFQHL